MAGCLFPSPLVGEGGALRAFARNEPGEGVITKSRRARPLTRPHFVRAPSPARGEGTELLTPKSPAAARGRRRLGEPCRHLFRRSSPPRHWYCLTQLSA